MSSSLRLGRVATPDSWSAVTMEAREAPDAWADAIIRESTVFPSSGNAANGKPIFNWDQAAAQLRRGGFTWSRTLGAAVRKPSNAARHAAQQLLESIKPSES